MVRVSEQHAHGGLRGGRQYTLNVVCCMTASSGLAACRPLTAWPWETLLVWLGTCQWPGPLASWRNVRRGSS